MRPARLGLAALLFACCGIAAGDGGRLRSQQDAGAFRVAIFTQPDPLVAGPADISVLLQDRESGEPVLDADVTLVVSGSGAERTIRAGRHSRNRLFYGATVDLAPGSWTATVRVRRGTAASDARAAFEVGPYAADRFRPWPYLALPPVVIVLFAANRRLRRRPARVLEDTCGKKEKQ